MNNDLKKRLILLSIFILMIVITVSYISSINNHFLNVDDDIYILKNPLIKKLSIANIIKIFGFDMENKNIFKSIFMPVTFMTFAIEYHFFGLNPSAYHMTSILFHILNTLMVFLFIYLIFRNIKTSLITSIIFGVHPIHVESVAWVSEMKDLLYVFFFLLAIVSYIYCRESVHYSKYFYFFSLVFFVLSLLSKPMAIVLPLIVILIDFFHFDKRKKIIGKIPFFLIVICYLIFVFSNANSINQNTGQENQTSHFLKYGFTFFFSVESFALLFYLIKIIIPVKLSFFYSFNGLSLDKLSSYIILSPLFCICLFAFIFICSAKSRKTGFAFLFFLITLLPRIVFMMVPPQLAADRFAYLPSIGILYLISEVFLHFLERKPPLRKSSDKILKTSYYFLIAFIVAVLSIMTFLRCGIWKNSLSLWQDVLVKTPGSVTACFYIGRYYADKNRFKEAMEFFNKGIDMDSGYADLFNSRGVLFNKNGEYDKAINDFTKAIKLSPCFALAYLNRGIAFMKKGEFDNAESDFNISLRLNPFLSDAYNNRGIIYADKKDYKNALIDYNNAIRHNSENSLAYNSRGYLFLECGEFNKALYDFNKAIILNPYFEEAYSNRARLYIITKDFNKAIGDCEKAIKLNPDNQSAHFNIGTAFLMKKEFDSALLEFSSVIIKNPQFKECYFSRGTVYSIKGDYSKALNDYNTALELDSGYIDVYYNRGLIHFESKDFNKAIKDFTVFLNKRSDSEEAYKYRGKAFSELKDYQRAIKDFISVLKMNPSSIEVKALIEKDRKKLKNEGI